MKILISLFAILTIISCRHSNEKIWCDKAEVKAGKICDHVYIEESDWSAEESYQYYVKLMNE